MFYQKEIETLPLSKLRKLQSQQLENLVDYVYQRVPFYKTKFDQMGIKPSEIRNIEDISKLPFTFKTDLRDNYPFDLFAVSPQEIKRIHCSSGTTGKPTVVGYTKNDLSIFAQVTARSLAAAGAQPGMKLHNAYGYGLFTGGLGLHYGGELLGLAVVPVSGGMTDRQLLLLQDFKPEVICCTPSYAQTLAQEVQKRNIKKNSLNLKYAVLGAEPWTETIRQEVQEGLGVIATNIYGLSEIIGPGVSQEDYEEQGGGSHVWEDHFFPEIIDPETQQPLPEGKDGVLVFTTLTKEGMPLLRYWTNDITHLYYDTDSKRTHIKMGPIKGRSDDMLVIRGVNLFPSQVEEVLNGISHLSANYQLWVTKKDKMDALELRVELDHRVYQELNFNQVKIGVQLHQEFLDDLSKGLTEKIKNNIGLTMKVTLQDFEQVPRSTGGKLSRVVDKRRPESKTKK